MVGRSSNRTMTFRPWPSCLTPTPTMTNQVVIQGLNIGFWPSAAYPSYVFRRGYLKTYNIIIWNQDVGGRRPGWPWSGDHRIER